MADDEPVPGSGDTSIDCGEQKKVRPRKNASAEIEEAEDRDKVADKAIEAALKKAVDGALKAAFHLKCPANCSHKMIVLTTGPVDEALDCRHIGGGWKCKAEARWKVDVSCDKEPTDPTLEDGIVTYEPAPPDERPKRLGGCNKKYSVSGAGVGGSGKVRIKKDAEATAKSVAEDDAYKSAAKAIKGVKCSVHCPIMGVTLLVMAPVLSGNPPCETSEPDDFNTYWECHATCTWKIVVECAREW